ncbi:MAG: hypothetical protein ACHQFX_04640 [Chitinophagales bacterium]
MNLKGVVDILGIVLPALILLLGIIGQFSNKRKGHQALTMLSAILLLLVGLMHFYLFPLGNRSTNSDAKLKPVSVSKHSETFNLLFENILNAYYKTTEAFANSDMTAVNQSGNELKTALDNFSLEELKADTLIYETALQPIENARAEVNSVIAAATPAAKKIAFKNLSDNLFNLVSVVHYDVAKLYWLECDAAFGENNPGNWLSKSEKSANPYGQQDCAEVKTNINFVPADTTNKAK